MIAKQDLINVKELFDKSSTIPLYQRLYSCDNEQVETLILAIEEAYSEDKNYLISNLILHEAKGRSSISVFYGQQSSSKRSILCPTL